MSRRSQEPTTSPDRTKGLIQVYEVEPGKGREGSTYTKGLLAFFSADGPPLHVGDILVLQSGAQKTTKNAVHNQVTSTAYRVVERQHAFLRDPGQKRGETKAMGHVASRLFVRRLREEEHTQEPGTSPFKVLKSLAA